MSNPIRTSFLSSKTEVRASTIQGRGLFAREEISQGEIVAIKGGQIFDRPARDALQRSLGPAEIQIGEDLFIGPTSMAEREGSMIFSNHSCEPNIGVQGQIVFLAMRTVRAGEELTHDWATTDCEDYEMSCNCGAAGCRKTITGQDWRRKELQEKYRGYFSWYLEKKIRESVDFSLSQSIHS
jgi:SET domain-containing protein